MKWKDFLGRRLEELSSRFEQELAREILASERMRATLLAGLFAFGLLIVLVFPTFFYDEYLTLIDIPDARRWVIVVFSAGLAYELFASFEIWRMIRQGKNFPVYLRYVNVFVETSIPTVGLVIMSQVIPPPYVLLSPLSMIYFLMILLSTLRLDLRLCLLTGVVACVEYSLLSLWFLARVDEPSVPALLMTPGLYVSKGIVMLLAGVIAGLVAAQIRRRFVNTYRIIEERNQVVSLFGQQVSQAIVDEMLKGGFQIESKRRTVCVMFLDIRNFTPFAERHSPEQIVSYLNTLFGAMIEVINRHHGIINQFVGDGFMATFGAPISNGNDCHNAVSAAREIVDGVRQMSQTGTIPSTRIGIGIHTGEAVTGNVGSALRQQYSITGDVVILASRIEQLNKELGSELLVSHEVYSEIDPHDEAESMGSVQVKGHNEPVHIYKLA